MVEDNKISLNDQIKEKQMLGRGLFGRTFSGDRNGYKCAKKIIDISELTQDQKISICTELKAMEQVKSEAAFYLPPQDFEIDELSKVLVITSELELGTLGRTILEKKEKSIEEYELMCLLENCARGLTTLHANGIIHRNLKADNILKSVIGTYMIADACPESLMSLKSFNDLTRSGNLLHSSPELLDTDLYTEKTDIWALGIIGYRIMTGTLPFKYQGKMLMIQEILEAIDPLEVEQAIIDTERFSKELAGVVASCLTVEPSKRPTAKRLNEMINVCKICKQDSKLSEIDLDSVDIDLSNKKLCDADAFEVANLVKNSHKIEILRLGMNKIGNVGAIQIANMISENSTIIELDLGNNRIGLQGMEELSIGILANYNLRKINLMDNKFGDEGVPFIKDIIVRNPEVEEIYLGFNRITNGGAEILAQAIKAVKGTKDPTLVNFLVFNKGIKRLSLCI